MSQISAELLEDKQSCLEVLKFSPALVFLEFSVCFSQAASSPLLSEGGGGRCCPAEEEIPEEAQAGVCGDPSASG